MILSDRPGRDRPAGVTPARPAGSRAPVDAALGRPVAKAVCGSCGRPVANLRSPTCIYCGAAVPAALQAGALPAPRSRIPPELLAALEPRASDESAERRRWAVRMAAMAVAGVMILLLVRLFAPRG